METPITENSTGPCIQGRLGVRYRSDGNSIMEIPAGSTVNGGDASVIGKTIELDRQPYTVIGVMPRDFQFPLVGPSENGSPAALWVPMAFTPAELQA